MPMSSEAARAELPKVPRYFVLESLKNTLKTSVPFKLVYTQSSFYPPALLASTHSQFLSGANGGRFMFPGTEKYNKRVVILVLRVEF